MKPFSFHQSVFFLLFLNLISLLTTAQVGIGTATPDSSALLDISSTSKGFLPPRMTTLQRNQIVKPSSGLTIYNTSNNQIEFFTGKIWNELRNLSGAADNGLMRDNTSIILGNSLGSNEAELKTDREIPLASHELRISQNGTGYMNLSGNGNNFAGALLRFNDTLASPIGTSTGRTWLQFNPLEKNQDSSPFLFSQTSTKYGSWQPNEVFMMGWNLAPGGGAVTAGQPGVGVSMEQHFKPDDSGPGFTEMHDFWIKPSGEQVRLMSYTLNNGSGDVDFYNTISRHYIKDPLNKSRIWYSLDQGPTNVKQVFEADNGISYAWSYDNQGIQLSAPGNTSLYLNAPNTTHLQSLSSTHNFTEFSQQVLPQTDNSLEFGRFNTRWAEGNFVKVRSSFMQLRGQGLDHPGNDLVTKVLDVADNSGGVLLPRLSQGEINAIANPIIGELLFNTGTSLYQQYTSTGWKTMSASSGEELILVPNANYTVSPANGVLQNIIYEYPAGGGTITLPALIPDNMTLYISNTSNNIINFSLPLYTNSTTSTSVMAAGAQVKLIYKNATGKWYSLRF
ncbi:MAG: hypothetical protein WKF97_00005 [Chitinophagaceae bacterium]